MPNDTDTNMARVTISLHPTSLEAIEGFAEHSMYLAPAVNAFRTAFDGLQRVHDAREAAASNTAWNDDEKVRQVSTVADGVVTNVLKKFDEVTANFKKQVAALEEQLNGPLAHDAERTKIGGEIRAHFKSLSVSERQTQLNQAHNKGDHETMRAVLGAPSYLSGVTEEMRQIMTRMHHEQRSPEAASRLQATKAALDMLMDRGPLIYTREYEKAVGASRTRVNAIQAVHSKAANALKAVTA